MKKDSIYLILLILLVLVFFSKVILHPHSVLYSQNSDYVQAHFPLRYAIVNDFEQYHDVPLWLNLDLGFPFLYLYGYPLEWPLLLFPGLGGYEYILHFLILTIGCFYFGKKISLSPYAAFVSAIIVTFSLRVVAHLYAGHSTIVFTFAYIPWLFLAAELIIEKRKVVFALLLAIPLYLALAAEHIHIFFYTSFMLCFYILLRLIVLYTNNIKMYAKPLLCVGIAFLIAVLCSAPVIYKYADFSLYHTRAGGKDLGFSSTTSMHVTNIISLFLPTFFGTPLHYWGFTGNFWEGALYIGLLTIILIIFALRLVRNEHILTFSALALFSLIFAFGTNTPLYMLFHNFIPGFAYFRAPSRMIIFFAFFGAFLAGFGLDEFFSLKSRVFKSFILKIWTIIMTLAVITTLLLLAFKNQFLLYGQSLLHYLYFEK